MPPAQEQECGHSRFTEWVSPRMPSGASSFMWPLRIFSSFGNGGKNKGGGGWPGAKSGMFGGAEVNADRLCAYARSSGYGIEAVVMAIRSRKAGTKAKAKAEAGRDKETAGKRELTH